MTNATRFEATAVTRMALLACVVLGACALGYGLDAAPERTWLNVLLDGFYLLSLGVSAIFFVASQLMAGARWSACLRRVPEALMLVMPLGAVIMSGLFFGRRFVYPWSLGEALGHGSGVAGRGLYLHPPFVFARMGTALALWTWFAWLFRKTSIAQDQDRMSSLARHRSLTRYAAAFLLTFAPTFTFASYDWVLSLEPHWFSTMFAVYVFAGTFVQGIAAITVTVVVLRQKGLLGGSVDPSRLHDLGKLLFAFSTFWAYIWLCQYLLVWYGNIPEEATYYVRRTNGPWLTIFALNLVVNWLVPFVTLMSARAKRNPRTLLAIAILLLAGHWLDLYVLIMPARWQEPQFGILEVMVALGCAAFACVIVMRGLSRAPLIPVNDPILAADRLRSAHGHA